MNKIRVWCAAATVRGLVFVFGGFQGETATEVLHAGMAAFLGVGPPTTEERECCEAVELDEDEVAEERVEYQRAARCIPPASHGPVVAERKGSRRADRDENLNKV